MLGFVALTPTYGSRVLMLGHPDRLPRERAPGRGWPAGRRPSSPSQGSEWLRAPFRGAFARLPVGTSTALCTCAIRSCSASRLFRHKARRAGKACCLHQRRNAGAGQPGAALRVDWCAPRAALRRLPRARAIACAPRLALNAHQPTAATNGTGAECFGGAFLSYLYLGVQRKVLGRVTQAGSKLETLIRARNEQRRRENTPP
jgi:hypothetical protein